MSVQATTAVWKYSAAKGADLIVMLAIADAANADGRNAHPGMKRLTSDCRKDGRTVLESIQRCIEREELERTAQGHRGQAATFDIILPELDPFEERMRKAAPISDGERVREFLGKGAGKPAKGCGPAAPLPNNQQPLAKTSKSKTQMLRDWEKRPCPHDALHCNRVTSFCDRCGREWRELVA